MPFPDRDDGISNGLGNIVSGPVEWSVRYSVLEAVADTEGKALPAEGIVLEIVHGLPVKRQVQGNGRYLELYAQLSADAGVEFAHALVAVESHLDTGSCIEVDYAAAGEDEIIHAGQIEAVGIAKESEVSLQEAGRDIVLIRDFPAVTDAETQCTGLSGCGRNKGEGANKYNNQSFHKATKIVFQGQI